tara:strand:- start:543 stop:773 length:231 start_codon:yes stop_codon:yes gene_type:complete
MNEQQKKHTKEICEKIRQLTQQLDENIEKIEIKNQGENVKIEIKEKKFKSTPVAGRRGTKWDPTIINWKNSLRRPW